MTIEGYDYDRQGLEMKAKKKKKNCRKPLPNSDTMLENKIYLLFLWKISTNI